MEKTEIKEVKISEIKPNTWNPNAMDKTNQNYLRKSLDKYGVTQLVVVDEDMTIIDGEHRWRALQEVKSPNDTIQIIVVKNLSLSQKQDLSIAMNKIKGFMRQEKVAELIKGMDKEEVVLPFSSFELQNAERLFESLQVRESDIQFNDSDLDDAVQDLEDEHNKRIGSEEGGAPEKKMQGVFIKCSEENALLLEQAIRKFNDGNEFISWVLERTK